MLDYLPDLQTQKEVHELDDEDRWQKGLAASLADVAVGSDHKVKTEKKAASGAVSGSGSAQPAAQSAGSASGKKPVNIHACVPDPISIVVCLLAVHSIAGGCSDGILGR